MQMKHQQQRRSNVKVKYYTLKKSRLIRMGMEMDTTTTLALAYIPKARSHQCLFALLGSPRVKAACITLV